MRCCICDEDNATRWKKDYYCWPCKKSIQETILDNKIRDWKSDWVETERKPIEQGKEDTSDLS